LKSKVRTAEILAKWREWIDPSHPTYLRKNYSLFFRVRPVAVICSERILVNDPILHDDSHRVKATITGLCIEPLGLGAKNGEIFERVSIDDQNIGIGALLDNAKFSWIWVSFAGEWCELAARRSCSNQERVIAEELGTPSKCRWTGLCQSPCPDVGPIAAPAV
jgi:hypothetical protein